MKALFLVGGDGARLQPFTRYLPKPMIPVMGRPLLQRTCECLSKYGIDEVVMNPCYMPHKITEAFGDGKEYRLKIQYEKEREPLGTGGAIKNAERHFTDSFFVVGAGILHDVPLQEMMRFHKKMKADVTIAAVYVDEPVARGTIDCDADSYIFEFREKPKPGQTGGRFVNAGIYIFEPHVLQMIPPGRKVCAEREIFPYLLKAGRPLAVYRCDSYWMDIGTPRGYLQVHQDIFAGLCSVGETDFESEEVYIDATAAVHDSVQSDTRVFVGRRARVEDGCVLGQGVVVGDGAIVSSACCLEDVIVWPGTCIPGGTQMRHCVAMQENGRLLQFSYEELGIGAQEAVAGYGKGG